MNIAKEYGERLDAVTHNLKEGALERLLTEYPEHGFVIDGQEAKELFVNVCEPPKFISDIMAQNLQDMHRGILAIDEPFFAVIHEHTTTPHFKEGTDDNRNESNPSGEIDEECESSQEKAIGLDCGL
jgi:hypothetical protein